MPSLFGLTPQEIQTRNDQQFRLFQQRMIEQAETPREKVGTAFGSSLGQGFARGLGESLGLESPEMKRARDLEAILKEAQEETPEGGNFYPTLSKKLLKAGYASEALAAQMQNIELQQSMNLNQARVNQAKTASNRNNAMASRQAMLANKEALEYQEEQQFKQQAQEIISSDLPNETKREMLMQAASQYSDPDKVLSSFQNAANVKEQARQRALDRKSDIKQKQLDRENRIAVQKLKGLQNKEKAKRKADLAAAKAKNPPRSAREARYIRTATTAMAEAVQGMKNIVMLPATSTSGLFGSGVSSMQKGKGLLEAPIGAFKNSVTPEDSQRYNAEVKNIGKFIARMISGGLAVSDADIAAFEDQYRINEGDTALTAFTKIAQMRQTFEQKALVLEADTNFNKDMKKLIKGWRKEVVEAIPITVEEINAIALENDPQKTFGDALREYKNTKKSKFKPNPKVKALLKKARGL